MFILYLCLTIVTISIAEEILTPIRKSITPIFIFLSGVLAVGFATRYLDHRPFRSIGFQSFDATWWREFAAGALIGLLITGGILGVYLLTGWATVTGWFEIGEKNEYFAFAFAFILYLSIAITEEVMFRGYLITNLIEGIPESVGKGIDRYLPTESRTTGLVLIAIVISSAVFAEFHGNNLTAMQYVHFWLTGLLLGIPYVLTGRLALPIGIHLTYNLGLTNIFNVQGGRPAVIAIERSGPTLFATSEGLTETAFVIIGIALVLLWWTLRGVDPGISRNQ